MARIKADTSGAPTCRIRSTTMAGAVTDTPNFVMVHGIGMSHRYFDRLQAELGSHGNTHLLDLPGFGGMPKPGRQLRVEDYATAIAAALDASGIRSCVLIGHSMGAQFTTELALQRPDLVTDLVVMGPVTDSTRRSALWHTAALALNSLGERPLTNAMVRMDYARCGLPWYFTELPVMLGYSIDERLPLVTQPVLVVRGSIDSVARSPWCHRLADSAQHGQLVEIPGQPHVVHRGGAAEVARAILAFLAADHHAPSPALAPASDIQRGATFSRIQTVGGGPHGTGAPTATTAFHSIKVGDRLCRAYPVIQTGASAGEPLTAASPTDDGTARRTFVFIHGIGMSHRYFRLLSEELASYGDSYLIDLPGYGWTGRPGKRMTNPANADLVAALLDEIGVRDCVVVGHSMGVQTATELAITRPELVSSLVLIGPAIDARQRTVLRQALRLAYNSALEKPLLNSSQFLDVLRCGPRWYVAELAVALAYHLETRLPLVEQAVLVIRGSRDPVAGSRWSRSLAESARNGALLEIEGSPHAVHHSAPKAVATGIIEFTVQNEPLVSA
ncbi:MULTISPECIES: alpha/beta fold hydrolase [unclassified Arthrobacter]|uniref:alpha/beta fold hydrolase n=1 Tax=unclassified Arthrobacter TaxID=235627 RepID=UPI001490A93B|nr:MULTISPECIES: alpha/beta hydrolase [unclassified Arthrobacter]MBE0009229.1 alpha/beta hydrolase [Arthrobacter sp. AET 35A]NOJ62961.1 alpha/beta hydrolase [Arthrobacter sp. 147(2020)]